MFGHDDHDENKDKDANNEHGSDAVITAAQPEDDKPSGDSSGQDWQHPGKPLDDDNGNDSKPEENEPVITPGDSNEEDEKPEAEEFSPSPAHHSASSADDLIDIKQEALGKLTPLIDHLDQSPEDKFRTLMMMIQASDDQSLVKSAYEAALKIDDEKARAQALLDIVNEINYFTQNPTKSE